jgi:arabinofuranan 3-O-arabinosyltransferase
VYEGMSSITSQDEVGSPVAPGVIGPEPTPSIVDVAGAVSLTLAVPSGTGWEATVDGRELPSITVDGWAQAWLLPEGASQVSLRYASGEALRLVVGVAVLGWIAVLLVASGVRPRTRRPV